MPFAYSSEFREMVLDQMRGGRSVVVLARDLGIAESTLYRWKRQDLVDQGLVGGTSSSEGALLQAARLRIKELEAELAAAKRASELFGEDRVMRPKDLYPITEALGAKGHGLKASCRILAVSASGFFYWRQRPMLARAVRRAWLADVVADIWVRSRRTYGWRRVQAELAEVYGHRAGRNLLLSVMREQQICGLPRRQGRKSGRSPAETTADLVNREFDRDGPNQLWMTDITEHPTREGKLYLCAVLDAWSRKVVGWSIDRRATAAMVTSALAMAVASRRPAPGAVVHSDHGTQYTSWAFSQRLRKENLNQSLGTVGDAFDNAVVEAFWARMQTELLNTRKWKTCTELSTAIFDWIEIFYNRTRRHSSLGNISPAEFERRHQQQPHAA
ncbi:IS3 family transposase [Candidatus Poriferisocius sp.]|uniref:IS3 family transposase n=1 Tax=Candidatus Poriferisocius sp. TaxID=3101276 RepID=UPI003B5297B3